MDTDVTARAPKYQRIADDLRRKIRSGQYAAGTRIPAETELLTQYKVSLPTIRQALTVLRAEGFIESRQGIGTFIKESRKLHRRSLHLTLQAVGFADETTPAELANVVHAIRARPADDQPFALTLDPVLIRDEAVVLTPVPPTAPVQGLLGDLRDGIAEMALRSRSDRETAGVRHPAELLEGATRRRPWGAGLCEVRVGVR